jgi:hypothetical protein
MISENEQTYSPLDANHPAPAKHFPTLPYSTQRITGIFISNPEAIGNLEICVGLRRLPAKGAEVFSGQAVFVRWVPEDDDIEGLLRLWLLLRRSTGL